MPPCNLRALRLVKCGIIYPFLPGVRGDEAKDRAGNSTRVRARRPTLWPDRHQSSPNNYSLYCLRLSRYIVDAYAIGPAAIR